MEGDKVNYHGLQPTTLALAWLSVVPVIACCFHCLAENWRVAADEQGSLCGPWSSEAQAHSPPDPVSPVVSILPGEQEESDLILEEVDPHWEEDERQEGSSSTGSRISAAAPADEEEGEVVEQMRRWEPEKALERLPGKMAGVWRRSPRHKRAGSRDSPTISSLSLPPDTHLSPQGHDSCQGSSLTFQGLSEHM